MEAIVSDAGGSFHISGSTSLDVTAHAYFRCSTARLTEMGIGELIGLGMETMIISLCMKIMSVLITVILYGRMIEIYLYVSVAPIPAATVTNREWGTIGTNYLKGLVALAFQGFFIMVCVAIYAVLVAERRSSGQPAHAHSGRWRHIP
ncbi:MAG: VirB6/TrbL-like conjugal transfer protein, CD1112 family [Enterocloster bolteae]